MAYGQIHSILIKPLNPTAHGSVLVSIYKRDYVGAQSFLTINEDQFSIRRNFKDWNSSHLIGMTVVMAIQNTGANYFDFIDLMRAKEKEYKVIVEHGYLLTFTRLFEGYINVELTTQKYLKYQQINIVASSYIKKLENNKPASIETLQNKSFIDIISECLSATGSTSNIRANVSYVPEEDVLTKTDAQTFLNLTGIYTEIFWKNNIDRESSFTILEEICKTFSIYIYWWNNYWYIEQYSELWKETKTFVEYTNGVSYGPADEGVVVTETNPIRLVNTLVFTEMSQTLSCLPGIRKNSVRLELAEFLNFVMNDFTNVTSIAEDTILPYPLREWRKYQPMLSDITWLDGGLPFRSITNSIKRTIASLSDWEELKTFGLYTCFEFYNQVQMSIDIKFKYAIPDYRSQMPGNSLTPYRVLFPWYLAAYERTESGDVFIGFIKYNETNSTWNVYYNQSNPYVPADYLQGLSIPGSDFNADTGEVECTISISEVNGFNPDTNYLLKFALCTEILKENEIPIMLLETVYIGDVVVQVNGMEDEANLIEGEINEDYLLENEETLLIGDVPSINYKNGIVRGSTLERRTTAWLSPDSPPARSILYWKLVYLAKLNHITRQRLTGNAIYKSYSDLIQIEGEIGLTLYEDKLLRPFTLFTEDKQSNLKYILTGITDYNPKHQRYGVQLDEYDNETTLTIIA